MRMEKSFGLSDHHLGSSPAWDGALHAHLTRVKISQGQRLDMNSINIERIIEGHDADIKLCASVVRKDKIETSNKTPVT